jgi:hypothetical protein
MVHDFAFIVVTTRGVPSAFPISLRFGLPDVNCGRCNRRCRPQWCKAPGSGGVGTLTSHEASKRASVFQPLADDAGAPLAIRLALFSEERS